MNNIIHYREESFFKVKCQISEKNVVTTNKKENVTCLGCLKKLKNNDSLDIGPSFISELETEFSSKNNTKSSSKEKLNLDLLEKNAIKYLNLCSISNKIFKIRDFCIAYEYVTKSSKIKIEYFEKIAKDNKINVHIYNKRYYEHGYGTVDKINCACNICVLANRLKYVFEKRKKSVNCNNCAMLANKYVEDWKTLGFNAEKLVDKIKNEVDKLVEKYIEDIAC